jgi:hypothetical protein
VQFEQFDQGVWNGIQDQSSAIALAWTSEALFCSVKVVDDTHQNYGTSIPTSSIGGWKGDSVQIAFTSEARTEIGRRNMILYNYGLLDDGSQIVHHQSHPCTDEENCAKVAIQRFNVSQVTIYEMSFPAHSLGLDVLYTGYKFGFGLAVTDGDFDGMSNTSTGVQLRAPS